MLRSTQWCAAEPGPHPRWKLVPALRRGASRRTASGTRRYSCARLISLDFRSVSPETAVSRPRPWWARLRPTGVTWTEVRA